MDKYEFAKTLKNLRESNQITKSELARVSGFSRQAIHNWEKGTDSISLENADKLLKALGVEIKIGDDSNGRKRALELKRKHRKG